MKPELKAKWIEALENGEFKHGTGKLHSTVDDSYCCLGVLCAISDDVKEKQIYNSHGAFYVKEDMRTYPSTLYLQDDILEHVGLPNQFQSEVSVINDAATSFGPAIEYIKENL